MIKDGGMFSVNNAATLKNKINELMESKENMKKVGSLNSIFIKNKIGATNSILANLK
jgi:3-deoxy-D-manno-octulosonic-acid transferase